MDGVVFTGLGFEDRALDWLLTDYRPRRPDARDWAIRQRVLLIEDPASGVGIDLSIGALDFEYHAAQRSTLEAFPESFQLRVCSPSDLVVYKAFAGRARDWDDIEGILARSADRIDFDLVRKELDFIAQLAEDDTPWRALTALRQRMGA